MTFYKVRDPMTGLFQLGGCRPRWSTIGKTWNTAGHLRSHFTLMRENRIQPASHWEVLEFFVTTTPGATQTVKDFLK